MARGRSSALRVRAMEKRKFGRTGLDISVLTFGCGAVGGLMTKGAPADQERAVAHALEAGINHFDTAPDYGDGASEENVGRVLARSSRTLSSRPRCACRPSVPTSAPRSRRRSRRA